MHAGVDRPIDQGFFQSINRLTHPPTPAGHPFDTIKTKMQAQEGFLKGPGMVGSFTTVLKTQGIAGLYKGALPPLLGSGIYRSTQFAVFEALYTKWDDELGRTEIPHTK